MVYGLLALLVVLLDQATKYYVVTHFALGESVPVINNVFHWTFILNRGAAFGGQPLAVRADCACSNRRCLVYARGDY